MGTMSSDVSRQMPISPNSELEKNVSSANGRQAAGKNRMRIKILVNMVVSLFIACNPTR
jgi:hypothetical protein